MSQNTSCRVRAKRDLDASARVGEVRSKDLADLLWAQDGGRDRGELRGAANWL